MAEIGNGREGAGHLAVQIDFLRIEPDRGSIPRRYVQMNSSQGLLWANVSLMIGEVAIFDQEVLLHSNDVRHWARQVEDLLSGRQPARKETTFGYEQELSFEISSPELLVILRRHAQTPEKKLKRYNPPLQVRDINDLADVRKALAQWHGEQCNRIFEEEFEYLVTTTYGYDLFIGVDTGIAAGEQHITGEGPGILLLPEPEDILRFARDLRSEAEMVMLIDPHF